MPHISAYECLHVQHIVYIPMNGTYIIAVNVSCRKSAKKINRPIKNGKPYN